MKQENFNTFRVITGVAAGCLALGSMITGAAHAIADKFHETNEQLRERDQKIRELEKIVERQVDANMEHRRDVAASIRNSHKIFDAEFDRINARIDEIEDDIQPETE